MITKEIRFSICIPNYNYKKYLKLACESVLKQDYTNYEIVIADNQSTDGSIEFIKAFAGVHGSVKYAINPCNLGFAGNLDRVTSLAGGNCFILLSSDDLMNKGALTAYAKLIELVDSTNWVIGSSVNRINSDGETYARPIPNSQFWKESDIDIQLSKKIGGNVYKVSGAEMLKRSLRLMGNPYYFLTVSYPADLFRKVGGYGGGRMYNPDKWFNWKLFSEADAVYLIDESLFSYRWHEQNQLSLESSFGHLRYLVDDYRNTIEFTEKMMTVSGLTRLEVENSYVKRDIYRHGIGEFAKGRWIKSLRIFFFGLSTFPGIMIINLLFVPYFLLLLTTPVGSKICSFWVKQR